MDNITWYKYATSYFQLYESQFFHYNDAKACNYFLKFLEVFLSM